MGWMILWGKEMGNWLSIFVGQFAVTVTKMCYRG